MLEIDKEEFCDDYCKYAEKVLEWCEDPEEAQSIPLEKYCEDCPLGRLEE